jgi:prolyl-tRNA editing enzyme YbaK/EbsC (Cys-tRNA(Pro) deacylase)
MGVAPWPEHVGRVALFMRAAGAEGRIEELRVSCATAQEAADAIGCTLGQIVKSVVLVCDGAPVVVLAPGDRHVDSRRVARAVGVRHARVARPEEVAAATGFEPGAVSPFPLERVDRVLIERSLLRHRVVWCGAGSTRHLAALAPLELQRLARAEMEDVVAREPKDDAAPG